MMPFMDAVFVHTVTKLLFFFSDWIFQKTEKKSCRGLVFHVNTCKTYGVSSLTAHDIVLVKISNKRVNIMKKKKYRFTHLIVFYPLSACSFCSFLFILLDVLVFT